MKTVSDIAFSSNIAAAILNNALYVNRINVLIYGWGRTAANTNLSSALVQQASGTMTNEECHAKFPFVARRFILDRHICTYHSAVASCPGSLIISVYIRRKYFHNPINRANFTFKVTPEDQFTLTTQWLGSFHGLNRVLQDKLVLIQE